jgi:hypothetical protein
VIDERLDRTKLEFTALEEAAVKDVAYWMSKTPAERIEGIEYLRRWLYGDDQVDARLQRVFEFVRLGDE